MQAPDHQEHLPRLRHIVDMLNSMAAFSSAESWDNVGLLIGDADSRITGVMVSLDATEEVLEETVAAGCNLIVTHHPVIFRPLNAIRTDHATGRLIYRILTAGVAVVSCHTNLDVARHGVNSELAAALDLRDCSPLAPGGRTTGESEGFGRIGVLPASISGMDFISLLLKATRTPVVKIAGPLPESVNRVAVCGGSGADLAETAYTRKADIFITGEVKHSTTRWAEATGFCIADAGHYATERLVGPWLARQLSEKLSKEKLTIPVHETTVLKEPFTWYATTGSVVTTAS